MKKNKVKKFRRVLMWDLLGTDKCDIRLFNRIMDKLNSMKIECKIYRNGNNYLNIEVPEDDLKLARTIAEKEIDKLNYMMFGWFRKEMMIFIVVSFFFAIFTSLFMNKRKEVIIMKFTMVMLRSKKTEDFFKQYRGRAIGDGINLVRLDKVNIVDKCTGAFIKPAYALRCKSSIINYLRHRKNWNFTTHRIGWKS